MCITVCLAFDPPSSNLHAFNTFLNRFCIVHNADEVNSIYKEANSIKKLRHKNIVELYHAFLEGKQLIMIMELARGGELMQYV